MLDGGHHGYGQLDGYENWSALGSWLPPGRAIWLRRRVSGALLKWLSSNMETTRHP
jgi:hypothetical protein